MAEIRLRIEDNPSKAEEVAILKKLADFFSCKVKDTYLGSLFTEGFVNWCATQIGNDFPCDLYSWAKETVNYQTTQLNEELATLRSDLKTLTFEAEQKDKKVAELTAALDEADKHVESLIELRESTKTELSNTCDELREASEQLQIAEGQVVELKAKLYDLLHA